jgi:short-subunit dehydrogenase
LGLEIARQLAAQGCKLILVARDSTELEQAAEELSASGTEVRTIAADVSDRASIERLRDEALGAFGHIDILVNNAGIIAVGPIDSFEESDFERAMDTMYWGTARLTIALLPALLKTGDADIVNITSIGGKIAVPHLLPYSAAKFAATGFSKALGAELRGRGVHVLTVAPGLMRTGSFLNAEFAGDARSEYRWFALSSAMPGISMSASRAGEMIVRSLRRRDRELVITKAAQLGSRFSGMFPALTQQLLEIANDWLLPGPDSNHKHYKGRELHAEQSPLVQYLTTSGKAAAATHNEL